VGSLLHVKCRQSEQSIAACEIQVHAAAGLADGERMVRLGQAEDAAGAAMAMAQALASFRRASFTGLWRQLGRLRAHCPAHFAVLAGALAASPLFGESSHEPHQLLRVSQAYAAIHACYAGCAAPPPAHAALRLWRGWVDASCLPKVHAALREHLHCGPPGHKLPPSPTRSLHGARGRTVCTAFLDSADLARYHAGLSASPASCDALSLWWATDDDDDDEAAVHVAHDVSSGPWLADQRRVSAATLAPHQLLPFLHSELNLGKLGSAGSPLGMALPRTPESDTESRLQRRSAQKIQRKMIMERLRPLVLASEERFDYTDPATPGLRVSIRAHIRLAYDDSMADPTAAADGGGGQCLLKDVLEHGPAALDSCADTTAPPFAVIEVHLGDGDDQMPGWLAQMFFEGALVHPVLDFDIYLHAIATLCPQRASGLPYWLVDCSQSPFDTPPASPALRRILTAALATAVAVSILLTIWPCHQQIARIVVEMADVLAEWVGRLLRLHARSYAHDAV
ncbi:hypothetical protein IWQ56_004212, partial [Coemansia nantahalensis]